MNHGDYNIFENLFKAFSIEKRVVNSTIRKFSEDDLQIKGNIRQRVRYLITGTGLESDPQEASEEILLVDEVDVFFGEDCCIDVTCCAWLQSGSPEHPVAALTTGLVVVAEVSPYVRIKLEFRAGSLPKRPFHLHLCSAIFRRIKLNFFHSLGYNVLGIPLAAGTFLLTREELAHWVCESAMTLSSVSVVTSWSRCWNRTLALMNAAHGKRLLCVEIKYSRLGVL